MYTNNNNNKVVIHVRKYLRRYLIRNRLTPLSPKNQVDVFMPLHILD